MEAITQQLIDAMGIMFIGMGLVFLFLSILIVLVKLVAFLYAPKPTSTHNTVTAQVSSAGASLPSGTIDPVLVAAITQAVHLYRAQA